MMSQQNLLQLVATSPQVIQLLKYHSLPISAAIITAYFRIHLDTMSYIMIGVQLINMVWIRYSQSSSLKSTPHRCKGTMTVYDKP